MDYMSESQGSSKEGEKEEEKEQDEIEDDHDLDEGVDDDDAEPIMTEPDIELSYFSPPHETDFPVFPGPGDLEGEVTQNIIRDLTKSAETFFHVQRTFQNQQNSFQNHQLGFHHSQYFPGFVPTPQPRHSAGTTQDAIFFNFSSRNHSLCSSVFQTTPGSDFSLFP